MNEFTTDLHRHSLRDPWGCEHPELILSTDIGGPLLCACCADWLLTEEIGLPLMALGTIIELRRHVKLGLIPRVAERIC